MSTNKKSCCRRRKIRTVSPLKWVRKFQQSCGYETGNFLLAMPKYVLHSLTLRQLDQPLTSCKERVSKRFSLGTKGRDLVTYPTTTAASDGMDQVRDA